VIVFGSGGASAVRWHLGMHPFVDCTVWQGKYNLVLWDRFWYFQDGCWGLGVWVAVSSRTGDLAVNGEARLMAKIARPRRQIHPECLF
jgi:hypothetical protein